jgi:hypothetical protein
VTLFPGQSCSVSVLSKIALPPHVRSLLLFLIVRFGVGEIIFDNFDWVDVVQDRARWWVFVLVMLDIPVVVS